MFERAWESFAVGRYAELPPDLTPNRKWGPACWRAKGVFWRGWGCTRRAGHTGHHAAGDGTRIRAVWP